MSLSFFQQLLQTVPETGIPVLRVVMGPFWTLVETPAGIGLAATQLATGPTHGQHGQQMPGAGHLAAFTARELAENVLEAPSPARSIGLAALNALLPPPTGQISNQNASDWLKTHAKTAKIGMVGWFPFIPDLQQAGFAIEIFENDPKTGFSITADRNKRLQTCDILCVTATTLLNDTIDDLLAAANPDAKKILVGPSTPLSPALLDTGWAALCGARVEQADPVIRVIQEGGCFRQIRREAPPSALRLLTLSR